MDAALVDADRLQSLDDDVLATLRETLQRAGYDADFLARTEAIAPRRLDALRLPLVQAWLREQQQSAAVLARLFAYRDQVGRAELERVLSRSVCSALTEIGALLDRDGEFRSRLRLVPFFGLWLAADEADGYLDPVMGPGATTLELGRALPPRFEGALLDLGTGAGSLALLAASRGAGPVVGTDIDPRAIAFARFNARLNDLEVEWLVGDLLAPVAGRRFDWVVAQPPFVPSPQGMHAVTYLHGGARGDELCFALLGQLGSALSEQGQALVRFDTPPASTPLWRRVGSALGVEGLQTVLAVARGFDADTLSIGYAAASFPGLDDRYAEEVRRYRAHLRALDIERVDHVLLWCRRCVEGPAVTVTLTPDSLARLAYSAFEGLSRSLSSATLPPDELDAVAVRVPDDLELVAVQPVGQGGAARVRAHFASGRAHDHDLSEAAAVLLQLAAEPDTVETLVSSYAEVTEASLEDVRRPVHDFVRDALVRGLLQTL